MKGRRTRHDSGVTLVETLAATGIAIILAGVASPLFLSAKEHAATSGEWSELRQLAIAQSVYTADTGGIPMSTLPLVQGGYISANRCASPVDTTDPGIANELDDDIGKTSAMYEKLIVPYRSSYLGMRELGFPYKWVDAYLKSKPTDGWLVSLTSTKRSDAHHWNSMYSGTYRRVCLDGSVKELPHLRFTVNTVSGEAAAQNDFFLFADGTNEWKRKFISGSL